MGSRAYQFRPGITTALRGRLAWRSRTCGSLISPQDTYLDPDPAGPPDGPRPAPGQFLDPGRNPAPRPPYGSPRAVALRLPAPAVRNDPTILPLRAGVFPGCGVSGKQQRRVCACLLASPHVRRRVNLTALDRTARALLGAAHSCSLGCSHPWCHAAHGPPYNRMPGRAPQPHPP